MSENVNPPIACSIYNAESGERIISFRSIKDAANHLGVPPYGLSAYIKTGYTFGSRRKKSRRYKYSFPVIIKKD